MKVDACELLRFLGIPAKRIADDTVKTISGWNWRDLALKYGRGADLAQSVSPTWSDMAIKYVDDAKNRGTTWAELATAYEQASEKTVTFCQDPRRDPRGWFYREDTPRSNIFSSISPVKGEPNVAQFLQRCGLMAEEVKTAIRCYEQKLLPPQGILRQLAGFPLAVWNDAQGRFDATEIKSVTLTKPAGDVPRGTEAVLTELTNGQKLKMLALRTEKGLRIPGLAHTAPATAPILRSDGGRSKNFIICDMGNLLRMQEKYQYSNIVPVQSVYELPGVIEALKNEDVKHVRLAIGDTLVSALLEKELVSRGIVTENQIDSHGGILPSELEKQRRTSAVRNAAAEIGIDI